MPTGVSGQYDHGQDARASASESIFEQKGESPFRANILRPVTESNCVVARPGGEQLEVKGQSVMSCELDSVGWTGEPASKWRTPDLRNKTQEVC